jgi:hypothetical protein
VVSEPSEAHAIAELSALAPLSEFCLVGRSIFFLEPDGYWSNALIENERIARFAYRYLVRRGTPYLDSTDVLCKLAAVDWHPSVSRAHTTVQAAEAAIAKAKVERLAAKLRELGVDPDSV